MPVHPRRLKVEFVLTQNIKALLHERRIPAKDLAFAVGHSQAWLSKVLRGERQLRTQDLDPIAEFFGLLPYELLSPGISTLTERRSGVERRRHERRSGFDRRKLVIT